MSKRLLLLPCIFLLSALALAACGSGSGDDTSQIEEAIEKSAAGTDPAACTEFQTQKFTEQTTEESGKAAVRSCEKEAEKEEGAESAGVDAVEVEGSSATAEVSLQGGSFDGQSLEVALVKDGDQWKLNEVVKFTAFDRKQLVKTFEAEFAKSSSGVSPQLASCFVEAFEKATQAEVEEMLFSGSTRALQEVAEGCPAIS